MKTKTFSPGDEVSLKTRSKTWKGNILQSHDSSVVLLKLPSGYNIGLRESEIIDAKLIKKGEPIKKEKLEFSKDDKIKNIAIIITGGTISSRLDPKSGGVISTDAEELLKIAPGISKIANITKIEKPFMKWSENMSFQDWEKIAKTCIPLLNDENIDGVIITHGTDFIHYTSAALSYFIKDLNKPIAITYSQRSIDRASTDAALNLICAAKFAASDIAEVALIGHENENDENCIAIPGISARKLHTSNRDAFKPVNTTPIARISDSGFEILKEFNARNNLKAKINSKYSNKVAIIKTYPGADPEIIEFYQKEGYKGLIIEVSGLGQVPAKDALHNWLPKIKKAIKDKMTVVATAQTIHGHLNPNVYDAGRALQKTDIIFSNLTTETAFVKLGWILGHKNWDVKEKLLQV